MRLVIAALCLLSSVVAHAAPTPIRCADGEPPAIDGLLDDWSGPPLAKLGAPADGSVAVRCTWDGATLAIALELTDDRIVRVTGKGHEDFVTIAVAAAGGKAQTITVYPQNQLAKAKLVVPAKLAAADALQPKGFSIEASIPAKQLAGFSASTPSLALTVTFHDVDQATGGDTTDLALPLAIALGDRADLLDDFLATTKLARKAITLDAMAELDPDRAGKERIVAGAAVIGILTDQFAYVTLPAMAREVRLLPLGARGLQIISAVVREAGNGGERDLLMLWTVWSGQLHALAQLEVRKATGNSVLASTWKIGVGPKQQPELVVTPQPAVGFTADTWNEEPATDADPIALPWASGGTGYTLAGHELVRRALPKKP